MDAYVADNFMLVLRMCISVKIIITMMKRCMLVLLLQTCYILTTCFLTVQGDPKVRPYKIVSTL